MYIQGRDFDPSKAGEEIFRIVGFDSGAIYIGIDTSEVDMEDMLNVMHNAICELLNELKARREKAKEN